MSSNRRGPAVARRQLRLRIRQARLAARKTQSDVAKGLDWSASKVLRIENSQVAVATSDLIALSTYLELSSKDMNELIELTRIARQPSPNTTYRDVLTDEFADWLEHEAYASMIRQYETKLVPGVLQTYDYADSLVRALVGRAGRAADEDRISRIVSARMERAEQLLGPDGPSISFILDEAVIRRGVGNERGVANYSVMTDQLMHLKELDTRGRKARGESVEDHLNPDIELQIVPFDLGAYQAMRGPFELLEFDEPDEDNMIYFENPNGDIVVRDTHSETAPYVEMFTDMQRIAPSHADSAAMIDQVIELISNRQNGIRGVSHDRELADPS